MEEIVDIPRSLSIPVQKLDFGVTYGLFLLSRFCSLHDEFAVNRETFSRNVC